MNKMMMSKMAPKKGGKSFPDMNKDGKVTKKDVLMAKGVVKGKPAMKPAMMKKK